MSGERIMQEQTVKIPSTFKLNLNLNKTKRKISGRVDINKLMSNLRNERRKKNKENLFFFGLVSSIIVITGIIASF